MRSDDAGPKKDEAGGATDDAGPKAEEAGGATDEAGPEAEQAGGATDEAGPKAEEAGGATDEAGPKADEASGAATDEAGPTATEKAIQSPEETMDGREPWVKVDHHSEDRDPDGQSAWDPCTEEDAADMRDLPRSPLANLPSPSMLSG